MALSGSFNTSAASGSADGSYYTFSWTASQSVANNTSTVSWTLKFHSGADSWYAERTLKVVIAGDTVYSKTGRVERYDGWTKTGTKTISHNSSGAGSFSVSVSAAVYYDYVNTSGSKTFTLNTIPRASSMTIANGTLGTAQNITVTKKADAFTHTITYTCGSASGTVCTKSSATTVSFTPPLALASQNTTGTSVSVTVKLQTYSGSTAVGSAVSKTLSMAIPSSVKPSCTIAVSDPTGYLSTYGGYVQGRSKVQVAVTATQSYSSAISSYSVSANGATYTTATSTTAVLKTSGTNTISATVKDKRGRTGSASTTISVLAYSNPKISKLKVNRCNSDGSSNDTGSYAKVTYSFSITSLLNKNAKTIKIKYRPTGGGTWTEATQTSAYSATDATYIFAAADDTSYDVQLAVTDAFTTATLDTVVSTAFTVMHFSATGKGMAIGKISEKDAFEVGMPAEFTEELTANTFTATDGEISRKGKASSWVKGRANAMVRQTTDGDGYAPIMSIKTTNGSWEIGHYDYSGWHDDLVFTYISDSNYNSDTNNAVHALRISKEGILHGTCSFSNKVLWSGARYMTADHTNTLSEAVTSQRNGIVLHWEAYINGALNGSDHCYFFVPKRHVVDNPGQGVGMFLVNATANYVGSKYVYVNDNTIVGNAANNKSATTMSGSGITFNSVYWVLTEVLGV